MKEISEKIREKIIKISRRHLLAADPGLKMYCYKEKEDLISNIAGRSIKFYGFSPNFDGNINNLLENINKDIKQYGVQASDVTSLLTPYCYIIQIFRII